jgi:hypothetical protein
MKLVQFITEFGSIVGINPEHVVSIIGTEDGTEINTSINGIVYTVKSTYTEVYVELTNS